MTLPVRWRDLRRFTTARVAIGRVGHAQPTAAHMEFQEAHALARDAVWSELDAAPFPGARIVASQAPDRRSYLLRPDLGRRLREDDRAALAREASPGRMALVIADGLCASGVQAHAPTLLAHLLPGLRAAGWDLAPLIVARQARVALGDDIGEALGAVAVAVLIGERPGLSSLDSLGIYLTWAPRRGRADAERNCISNVRDAGLSAAEASRKLLWLLAAAKRLGATGVTLKDEQPMAIEGAAALRLD